LDIFRASGTFGSSAGAADVNQEGANMADNRGNAGAAGAGAVYGLGFIGALVYFIGSATSFWDGVWGVLQSIVWPAFLVYGLLDLVKM
jgi:hypothetical protein